MQSRGRNGPSPAPLARRGVLGDAPAVCNRTVTETVPEPVRARSPALVRMPLRSPCQPKRGERGLRLPPVMDRTPGKVAGHASGGMTPGVFGFHALRSELTIIDAAGGMEESLRLPSLLLRSPPLCVSRVSTCRTPMPKRSTGLSAGSFRRSPERALSRAEWPSEWAEPRIGSLKESCRAATKLDPPFPPSLRGSSSRSRRSRPLSRRISSSSMMRTLGEAEAEARLPIELGHTGFAVHGVKVGGGLSAAARRQAP